MKLINIGYGNVVLADKVVAVIGPESAPVKRIIQDARDKGNLIDASYGRKTKSVIIMESDHIVLSSIQVDTITARLEGNAEEVLLNEG